MSGQAAGHRGEETVWGAQARSAALPHGLWHATHSAASCHLTGEREKIAIPGTAKRSLLQFSNKWYCIYLANYHYLMIYLESIHLESSKSTHYGLMNVYVVGRRILQRRNSALFRRGCRKPSLIYTVLIWSVIIYTSILKCVFILDGEDY